MQLVEEGRIDLHADIHGYLDFRIPEAFGAPITMRHLMTHTPGSGDKIPMVSSETRRAPFSERTMASREDAIERVVASVR